MKILSGMYRGTRKMEVILIGTGSPWRRSALSECSCLRLFLNSKHCRVSVQRCSTTISFESVDILPDLTSFWCILARATSCPVLLQNQRFSVIHVGRFAYRQRQSEAVKSYETPNATQTADRLRRERVYVGVPYTFGHVVCCTLPWLSKDNG